MGSLTPLCEVNVFPQKSLVSLPTVRLLALIAFFGQLYFFVPVMTPYLLQRGLSLVEIAGLQTALLIGSLVMEVPTGVLADRLGHVWSYRISLIVLASGEVLFLFARDYWAFVAIQLITGTGFAFASGSVEAVLYEALPAENRLSTMQRARGLLGGAAQSASVVAYSIGGIIAADLTLPRMTITIVMGAMAVATAALLSFGLHESPAVRDRARLRSRHVLREAARTIRGSRPLQRLLLLAIVTNAFAAHLLVFYQEYFLITGVSSVWLGLGLSLASVLVVITQVTAWKLPQRLGTGRALIVATVVPGVLYLAMAANAKPALAVLIFVAQWGAIHLSAPLFSGLYNIHLADGSRATALSLIAALTTIYVGVGGVILGSIAKWSLHGMFALLGVVIICAGIVFRVSDDVAIAKT